MDKKLPVNKPPPLNMDARRRQMIQQRNDRIALRPPAPAPIPVQVEPPALPRAVRRRIEIAPEYNPPVVLFPNLR